jgi:hypothetical protein
MTENPTFDRSAELTRTLLGWGVVAGPFYLLVGIIQGVVRDGFSFSKHALSHLMLGDGGWLQSANLILSGFMVIAAAIGFYRVISANERSRVARTLIITYGAALIGSGLFPPGPADGFPDPGSTAEMTTTGVVHLAFGAIGFLALSGATFVVARWFVSEGKSSLAVRSRAAGVVVLVGFMAGAALSAGTAGVLLIWISVVAGWSWLAMTSIWLYRTVPHPDLEKRTVNL